MRVWIDMSNSPHPLLFAPVSRRLEREGHEVIVTVRDNAQTLELTRERWPDAEQIGTESPAGRVGKARAMAARVGALRRWARARRPDVALSHNSYGQIVAARSLGLPVVTAMDFEHQPANHLAFRLAGSVLLPEPLPLDAVRRQGARARKVVRYPGLKEELYLGDFEPDEAILDRLGVDRSSGGVVVVARMPPSRAAYHRVENPLFFEALEAVSAQPATVCVVLARFREQRRAVAELNLERCVVPERAVDSRSLMHAADLVLGAGGTMTREAALMGVPTYTLYAGEPPLVDAWLEAQGSLRRLSDACELGGLTARTQAPRNPEELRARAVPIEDAFVATTLAAVDSR